MENKKIRGKGGEVKFLFDQEGPWGLCRWMHKKGKNVIKLRIKEREIHYKIKTSAGLLGTDADNVFIKD